MKVELKFVELQTPLFLEGVNHGVKLGVQKADGIKRSITLVWDTDLDKLFVFFKDSMAVIPSANVASMTPVSKEFVNMHTPMPTIKIDAVKPVIKPDPAGKPKPRPSAQVSSPTSHVFEVPKA